MNLSDVHKGIHKRKKRKRVGRGVGSGHGKTAGRGHKGQYATSAGRMPIPVFEGGQMQLFRRMPKRGFTNAAFARSFQIVNIRDLERVFSDGDTVDEEKMREAGLVQGRFDGIRVLGMGELTKKLNVKAHHFTKSAKEKIEAKGGSVEIIPPPSKPKKNKMKPRKQPDENQGG